MSRAGGANVTVTIGAAFAGSFKSVLREADRELRNFGKRGSRTMKGFDKAAKGAGKSVAATAKAAREAGSAIGALHRELPALRVGAKHTATAARGMRTLARDTQEATKAHKAHTAMVVRGEKAQPSPRPGPCCSLSEIGCSGSDGRCWFAAYPFGGSGRVAPCPSALSVGRSASAAAP